MNVVIFKANKIEEAELKEFFQTNCCVVFTASEEQEVYSILSQNKVEAILYYATDLDDFALVKFINKVYPSIKVIISMQDKLKSTINNIKSGEFTIIREPYRLNQLSNLFLGKN